jgi:opacity protein-like surface antigen
MKQFNKLALALAASLVAGSAMADAPKLYVVAGVGQGDIYDYSNDALSDVDTKDTAWQIAGGAQFNQYLAVEFQYQDWGEATGRNSDGDRTSTSATTVGISVLPQLPLTEELSVYGRLGFVRGGQEFGGVDSGSNWSTTNTFGFGLQYNLDEHFAIRGEYQFVRNLGDDYDGNFPEKSYLGENDAEYIGVSGVYKF